MASGGIAEIEMGVSKKLEDMVSRGRSVSAYLNRVLVKKFTKAQMNRWETEGSSEGMGWHPLTPAYAAWKKRKFADAPGNGTKLMIASGKLSSGAQLRDASYFTKLVTDSEFVISMNLGAIPYAGYAGDDRPYMEFSDETLSEWKRGIRDYICKNQGAL